MTDSPDSPSIPQKLMLGADTLSPSWVDAPSVGRIAPYQPHIEPPLPSTGRVVRYVDAVHGPLAAIVTAVDESGYSVYLTVFFPDRLPGYTTQPIPFSPDGEVDTWHWPARA